MVDSEERRAPMRQQTRKIFSRAGYFILPVLAVTLITYNLLGSLPNESTVTPPPVHAEAPPPVCQSPECVHAASEILYSLDPNYAQIDPCTNFDQYVCGGWRDRHDMRSDQSRIFTGTEMAEHAQTQLRHILEAGVIPGASADDDLTAQAAEDIDADNFGKLKAAYDACMDESAVRAKGTEPLQHLLAGLEDIYGLASDLKHDTKKGLTEALLYLFEAGVEALVNPGVGADDRDPDTVVVFVTPPRRIGLPAREYYNNTELVAEYGKLVEQVMGSFDKADAKAGAKDLVALEKRLADVTPDTQTQEDVTKSYNPRTIEETSQLLPEVDMSRIISKLAPAGYETDRLIVGSPSYMKALSEILHDTSRETIQSFLKWKLIQKYSGSIEDPAIQPIRAFDNKLRGKDPQATEERFRKCIRQADENLGWILSRFYILKAFPKGSKELGDQIVSDIKERFIFTLTETKWMSGDVRKLGIKKVENIVQKIGYPTQSPNVMDPNDVQRYYQDLHVSNETFFENELAAARFSLHFDWSQLGKPTDRNRWGMTTPTVNAYYNPPGNEIVFPAGIMQPPVFYGPSAPLYLLYGAFGAVSGHELSHAFDSTGRHYDETGNYTDWWDEETVTAFEERAQCFIDQYSDFTVPGPGGKSLHVNGRLTLGENIADAGGLGAAYFAWRKRDEASPDPLLPGLAAFSKDQLFFISYANWWCGKITKEAAEEAIYNDPHAPHSARIIETMANSAEFKRAFQCPDKKPVCKLW